jgi:hypothetical protein
MAKHIRNIATNRGHSFKDWTDFLKTQDKEYLENPNGIVRWAEEHAKLTGQEYETVFQQRWEEYQQVSLDFEYHIRTMTADREQTILLRNNLLDSFCSVFQKADRILSNLSVDVFLNDDPLQYAPAWNDGKNVTFNAKHIKALTDETVISLHGLNYHELAHLLFTPRQGTALGKWVMEKKTITHENKWKDYQGNEHTTTAESIELVSPARARAFNILEDCRAEYYMTTKYPSTRPFFTALLGEYIAKHQEDFSDNFVLLAGRKYFSLPARQYSAMAYAKQYGEEQAKQVYSICSEYRSLVYPRDYNRGQELIEQFIAIIPETLHTPSGCDGRPVMRNGKPLGEKELDAIIADDGEPDELNLDKNSAGYSITGDGDGEFNKDTKDFNTDKDQALAESVEQAVQSAKNDESLKTKVRETIKAINKDSSTKSILGKGQGTADEPTQAEITASRLFGQELERIRIECDPAWELERPTGKLNVRRAMNADVNEIGKLFDRWTLGNEDYDIECCIALDRSGSMWNEIGSASRSAWVIKRAIEKINGRVSVMTYNADSRMLYSADQKASPSKALIAHATGGTDPYYSLLESQRIFQQSKAKTKLLFLLTDGGFSTTSDPLISEMGQSGVFTSVIFLGTDEYTQRLLADPDGVKKASHGAKNFRTITQPSDLVKVAKDVVKHTIKAGR